jgi:hypothetical protein
LSVVDRGFVDHTALKRVLRHHIEKIAAIECLQMAYRVDEVRNCRFWRGFDTGYWVLSGMLTLVITRRSSARKFFDKICHERTVARLAHRRPVGGSFGRVARFSALDDAFLQKEEP